MKYHSIFVILKKRQNLKLSSAAILGGALRVKTNGYENIHNFTLQKLAFLDFMYNMNILIFQV